RVELELGVRDLDRAANSRTRVEEKLPCTRWDAGSDSLRSVSAGADQSGDGAEPAGDDPGAERAGVWGADYRERLWRLLRHRPAALAGCAATDRAGGHSRSGLIPGGTCRGSPTEM